MEKFLPAKNRGFSVGTGNGVMFDFGTFIAGFVSFFAISYLPVSFGWRIAFLTAFVLAGFIFVARLDLPESVRYLLRKGRVKEAEDIVDGIEAEVKNQRENYQMSMANIPVPGQCFTIDCRKALIKFQQKLPMTVRYIL